MKTFLAFFKKEWLEALRSGKILILVILFVLCGIMNPAIAKMTPWMMEILSDAMAESGFLVTDIQVDAMTSWTQFFKNIPIALIAYILIYSNIFTKEYQSGTLILVLTKGLSRYKVVLGKFMLLVSLWTLGYWLCFAITYGYNALFWDNSVACNLFFSAGIWYLFGVWIVCLVVLFSVLMNHHIGVLGGTGGSVLLVYAVSVWPKIKELSPAMLLNTASLLTDTVGQEAYVKSIVVTALLSVACMVISIPVMNKKQI